MKTKIFFTAAMLLLMCSSMVAQTIENYQKCFTNEWQPKSFAGFTNTTIVTKPAGAANVTVTVDPKTVKAKIPATIFGYSITYYGGNNPQKDANAGRYYKALNSPALRFPGGTPSDCYFWSATSSSTFPSWYKPASVRETNWRGTNVEVTPLHSEQGFSLADFYAMLKANPTMNAVMQVNYSAATYANFPTRAERVLAAAKYAADWVKDANITKGLKIKYWEVGNEIGCLWTPTGGNVGGNGYPDFNLGQHTVKGTEFAEDFIVFASEMKKVDPTIKVGACGDVNNNFTADCLKVNGFVTSCDWLAVHDYYGTWGAAAGEADLLSQGDKVENTANNYRNLFQGAGLSRDVLPIALTEWNTASVGNFATLSQGGAIMHAKAVGKEIETGYGMVNMFGMSDVWRNKGDLGLLSNWSNVAPTEQGFPAEYCYPNGTPSPVYYTYAYYAKTFGDKLVTSTCSDNNVRVYSSIFTNSAYVTSVIINQTNQSKIVELNAGSNAQNYYYYEITPASNDFFCTKIKVNGIGNENNYYVGGPMNFENIAPYSASAVGGIKIELKPYGIYFVMVATEIPVLTKIEIEPVSQTLMVGNGYQFKLKYLDKNNNPMVYSTTKPVWSVTGGGTVDQNGFFTPTTKGTNFSVSATIAGPNGQLSATAVNFNVDIPVLTSVVITPATKTLGVNEIFDFVAVGKDQNGNALTITPSWTVSGGGTISSTGTFTAQTIGGPYTITATASGKIGTSAVTVTPGCPANNVGATIEAEVFCKKSPAPKEEACSDVNTGKDMGYIGDGDWMSYWIDVPVDGSYKISYRVAGPSGGGKIDFKNGATSYGAADVVATNDWQNWTTVSHTVTLPAGGKEFTVFATKGGFNLNWIKVESLTKLIPGVIEAESYDDMFGVQTQSTTDIGGGDNVGYTDANDWLSYSVSVKETGTYTVSLRVASAVTTGAVQLKVGANEIMTKTVENTGDWQKWVTLTADVSLTKGANTLRVNFTGGGVNLNWVEFVLKDITTQAKPNAIPEITVYPNPVNSDLFIDGSNIESVTLYTLDGRELLSQDALSTHLVVNVELLSKGFYILKIRSVDGIISKKIIKE